MSDIREEVRARYAEAAERARVHVSSCCGPGSSCCDGPDGCGPDGAHLYPEEDRAGVPEEALLASLGCGNPAAVADLRPGEAVLDLGSGGGIDVLLSARRVGPTGVVYGLDMTEEMLALAAANRAEAGVANAHFLRGYIEDIPLPAATVDVVISNCVVNLSADKGAAFREMHRVLRPGGRIGITDIVASNKLSPQDRSKRGSYVGCIAGALSFEECERGLDEAGFESIEVIPTHEVADGMFAAVIRATKLRASDEQGL
jgi:arsenite methyltransferase